MSDALEAAERRLRVLEIEHSELLGRIEAISDERFDAGYQMAIEHCLRICQIAVDDGLGLHTVMARIGLHAPDPSRLKLTASADAGSHTSQK